MKFFKINRLIYIVLFLAIGVLGYCFNMINPVVFVSNQSVVHDKPDVSYMNNVVKNLVEDKELRNHNNLSKLNKVKDFIFEEFKKVTDRVELQSYNVGENLYHNVICSLGPIDGERIIVGAHYDSCHETPGADDNSSGIAGLLESVKLLAQNEKSLKFRVDFVAYTLEEPPYFRTEQMGSAVHAKYLFDHKIAVKAMLCLEMIGYFSQEKESQEYPLGVMKVIYPTVGNFIAVVGKTDQSSLIKDVKKSFMGSVKTIGVESLAAPEMVRGIDFSDHLNYWKYGFKAVMITDTAFFRNQNYHKKTDTIDTLDFEKMAEVVSGLVNTILNFN